MQFSNANLSQTKAKVSLAAFYEWKSVDREKWIVAIKQLYMRAV